MNQHLYANKFNNFDEIDKFLETYKLKIMLNQEEMVTSLALHILKN